MIIIKTNSTRPMVKRTCLCTPAAYPISLTIAVVRKRTELNGRGMLTELPDTRVIAIASPMARPTPSTMAVTIPDFAAGRITRKIVWMWEAPRARDADLSCGRLTDIDHGRKDHDRQYQNRRKQIGSSCKLVGFRVLKNSQFQLIHNRV